MEDCQTGTLVNVETSSSDTFPFDSMSSPSALIGISKVLAETQSIHSVENISILTSDFIENESIPVEDDILSSLEAKSSDEDDCQEQKITSVSSNHDVELHDVPWTAIEEGARKVVDCFTEDTYFVSESIATSTPEYPRHACRSALEETQLTVFHDSPFNNIPFLSFSNRSDLMNTPYGNMKGLRSNFNDLNLIQKDKENSSLLDSLQRRQRSYSSDFLYQKTPLLNRSRSLDRTHIMSPKRIPLTPLNRTRDLSPLVSNTSIAETKPMSSAEKKCVISSETRSDKLCVSGSVVTANLNKTFSPVLSLNESISVKADERKIKPSFTVDNPHTSKEVSTKDKRRSYTISSAKCTDKTHEDIFNGTQVISASSELVEQENSAGNLAQDLAIKTLVKSNVNRRSYTVTSPKFSSPPLQSLEQTFDTGKASSIKGKRRSYAVGSPSASLKVTAADEEVLNGTHVIDTSHQNGLDSKNKSFSTQQDVNLPCNSSAQNPVVIKKLKCPEKAKPAEKSSCTFVQAKTSVRSQRPASQSGIAKKLSLLPSRQSAAGIINTTVVKKIESTKSVLQPKSSQESWKTLSGVCSGRGRAQTPASVSREPGPTNVSSKLNMTVNQSRPVFKKPEIRQPPEISSRTRPNASKIQPLSLNTTLKLNKPSLKPPASETATKIVKPGFQQQGQLNTTQVINKPLVSKLPSKFATGPIKSNSRQKSALNQTVSDPQTSLNTAIHSVRGVSRLPVPGPKKSGSLGPRVAKPSATSTPSRSTEANMIPKDQMPTPIKLDTKDF